VGNSGWKIVRPSDILLLSINRGIMFRGYIIVRIQFSSWPCAFINVQNVGVKRCCNKPGYNSCQFISYASRVWSLHRWKLGCGRNSTSELRTGRAFKQKVSELCAQTSFAHSQFKPNQKVYTTKIYIHSPNNLWSVTHMHTKLENFNYLKSRN
jgi:hypothetical protein